MTTALQAAAEANAATRPRNRNMYVGMLIGPLDPQEGQRGRRRVVEFDNTNVRPPPPWL